MNTKSLLGTKPTSKLKHPGKPKSLSFKRKKKVSPFQFAAEGLKVQGPSHEEGGIEARTPDGKPVAEIEGQERIFSKENTVELERSARNVVMLLQKNVQAANQAAQDLGFRVVEMLINQEKNQREQEGEENTEDVDQAADVMNQFGNAGGQDNSYSEQPA